MTSDPGRRGDPGAHRLALAGHRLVHHPGPVGGGDAGGAVGRGVVDDDDVVDEARRRARRTPPRPWSWLRSRPV